MVSLTDPDTVVEQPSVSRMIAEQLARGPQEEKVGVDEESKKVAEKEDEDVFNESDTEEDEQTQSNLDSARNQSFHISGENIDLDDIDGTIEEPHDESVSESEEEKVKEESADVTFAKKLRGGELDTTTVITSMLSELASESDSRETSVGR